MLFSGHRWEWFGWRCFPCILLFWIYSAYAVFILLVRFHCQLGLRLGIVLLFFVCGCLGLWFRFWDSVCVFNDSRIGFGVFGPTGCDVWYRFSENCSLLVFFLLSGNLMDCLRKRFLVKLWAFVFVISSRALWARCSWIKRWRSPSLKGCRCSFVPSRVGQAFLSVRFPFQVSSVFLTRGGLFAFWSCIPSGSCAIGVESPFEALMFFSQSIFFVLLRCMYRWYWCSLIILSLRSANCLTVFTSECF